MHNKGNPNMKYLKSITTVLVYNKIFHYFLEYFTIRG